MKRWEGKVGVVTGASAGIGAAIAEALVSAGLKVAGIARRKERVEELAKKLEGKSGKLYTVQADISTEEDIIKAFDYIKRNIGPVSILVNNAGIARLYEDTAHGTTKVWNEIFDVNVVGLLIATREAIKSMEENKIDGHIIHINSVVGHQVDSLFPTLINVYPASKFAVRALAETLRLELDANASKIKVTDLSPGLVKTEIFGASGKPGEDNSEQVKSLFENQDYLNPEDIAESVLYVLGTKPHVQIRELIISDFEGPKRFQDV